jgi:peptidoglycan/LPS O-acetylase OafA/YrhL
MLYHFNVGSYYPVLKYWQRVTSYGYLGVAVFFVISGFCIGKSWLKSPDAGAFLRQRFWRIYPAFLASILLIVVCAAVRKEVGGINDVVRLPARPVEILAVLTLFTAPATSVPTVNWVFWSLTYELFFYFVMGAVLWVPAVFRRRQVLLGIHVALCALSLTGISFSGTPLFFVDDWNLFGMGIGICFLSSGTREGAWFLGISAVTLAAKIGLGHFGPYDWAAVVAVGLLLMPHRRLSLGRGNPLVFLGRISYSLYLLHVPVGLFVFMRLVRPWIVDSRLRFASMQFVGVILVIAVSALSYRFFEQPFLRRRARPVPA